MQSDDAIRQLQEAQMFVEHRMEELREAIDELTRQARDLGHRMDKIETRLETLTDQLMMGPRMDESDDSSTSS